MPKHNFGLRGMNTTYLHVLTRNKNCDRKMASAIYVLEYIKEEEPRFIDQIDDAIGTVVFHCRMTANLKDKIEQQQLEIDNLRRGNKLLSDRCKQVYNEMYPVMQQASVYQAEIIRLRKMMALVVQRISTHEEQQALTLEQKEVLNELKREVRMKQ